MWIFLRWAVVILVSSAEPAMADQTWTMADLDAVADAAIEANQVSKVSVDTFRLVQLADALMGAGNTAHAKVALIKAASRLSPVTNFAEEKSREDIVERLAQLGGVADAEALAGIDAAPGVKVALLGKLGTGRARAGDFSAAQNAAKSVKALVEANAATNPAVATSAQVSLAEIAIALSASGATDEALRLAEDLPDGLQKLRVYAKAAHMLCGSATKRPNEQLLMQNIADKATHAARQALSAVVNAYERFGLAQTAAETIAICIGPAPAKALVGEVVPFGTVKVLSRLADQFLKTKDVEVARALAPSPDPTNAESLLDDAKQLMLAGDRAAAARNAIAASQVALAVQRDPAVPPYKWADHNLLLGRIFGVLTDLGLYDEAMATVQPIDAVNRQQYYVAVVEAEVRHKDVTSISHTLPASIGAIKQSIPGGRGTMLLYQLTNTLAAAGYTDEAKSVYDSLLELSSNPSTKPLDRLQPSQLAVLKADFGDMVGALSIADAAGPMVAKPSDFQIAILATMQFDGATKKPTEAEVLAATQRAREALPSLVAGPKANALVAIVAEMAAQGNIEDARRAETGLDVEPRDVLRSVRDMALVQIAKAQEKAGDLRGSFSTALKITEPPLRLEQLLKLAARPPTQ
jgi:tetratricopeptide (TPR) repeat protein